MRLRNKKLNLIMATRLRWDTIKLPACNENVSPCPPGCIKKSTVIVAAVNEEPGL